ncbi:LLM class flavin-dependent oxidoreductase [Streptomyces sp. RB6PN25]|uniref:LLM class flavin-dependent oxidoreductase n=1 Tax=Streptomyces humicola TaxID=2953240 RepID=A0ABT1Q2G4_9ACTN|nr:LLM class flavin-dependent oxidoreductase [Streptomyces humicola]MCQ4083500.1 LLM class flavin-dependent oxidoreductase [Streptomyces humicola]
MIDDAFMETVATLSVPETGTDSTAPLLYRLIRSVRPRRVLAIGMGYTTPFLAMALQDNATAEPQPSSETGHDDVPHRPRLVCVDRTSDPASCMPQALKVLDRLGVRDLCTVIESGPRGAAHTVRDELGLIDFAWIDTWDTPAFLREYGPLLNPAGGILAGPHGELLEVTNLRARHRTGRHGATLISRIRDHADPQELRPQAAGGDPTGVEVHSVTPESVSEHQQFRTGFLERLTHAAQASEEAGWSGILVPHNLHEVDPWIVATYLGAVTTSLVPLIAVQPACTPPHTAAACAAAYARLYGRPLDFNLVAGARDDEMRRIGDTLSHDERYDRMRQYGRILRALLNGEEVDECGSHYTYRGFRLEPRPQVLEKCRIFVAGSSPASLATAREIADVVVTHPAPFDEWRESFLEPLLASGYTGRIGIRIGLLCRADGDVAWRTAEERFPESWAGRQETLLKTRSQNVWSRQLALRAVEEGPQTAAAAREPYWLGAFRSGRASAPFLVGAYDEVAERLAEYVGAGVGHVLLNGGLEEDYPHIRRAVERAAGSM